MSIAIDHVGIPAADPWAAARFLREILAEGEITPEGPDGEMASLSIGDGALTYFGLAAHEPHHVALRVTGPVLAGVSAGFASAACHSATTQPTRPTGGRMTRSAAGQGSTSTTRTGTCSSCSSLLGPEPG